MEARAVEAAPTLVVTNAPPGGAPASAPRVHAAGGVVVRRGTTGDEIVLVHRRRYDDWSLPKGKLEPGETFEDAARREVEEETGLRCALGQELASVEYLDRKGRPKLVRYWLMDVAGTGRTFTPNAEVDELRWCALVDAVMHLSYEHDRDLVRSILA